MKSKLNDMIDPKKEGFTFFMKIENPTISNVYVKEFPYRGNPSANVQLIANRPGWVLISVGDDETPMTEWSTIFAGRITTQEDLKKVLGMILI